MENIENYANLPEIEAYVEDSPNGQFEKLVEIFTDKSKKRINITNSDSEEYENLPKISAELVEELRKKTRKTQIEGYDPSNLANHLGTCYIFSDSEKLKNLILMPRKEGRKVKYEMISTKGRPLKGRDIRLLTFISPENVLEALDLVTAPLTTANRSKLTRFINRMENRNGSEVGKSLLTSFTKDTQHNRSLGFISPAIYRIDTRRIN